MCGELCAWNILTHIFLFSKFYAQKSSFIKKIQVLEGERKDFTKLYFKA